MENVVEERGFEMDPKKQIRFVLSVLSRDHETKSHVWTVTRQEMIKQEGL